LELTAHDLLRLPQYQAYARLLIDGTPSRPFSMRTLPPPAKSRDERRPEIIRSYCRRRYTRPDSEVEAQVRAAFTRC
jgi:hypothetical protein